MNAPVIFALDKEGGRIRVIKERTGPRACEEETIGWAREDMWL